jgi:hypothetical protein
MICFKELSSFLERLGNTIKTFIMVDTNRLVQNTNPERRHYAILLDCNVIPIEKRGDEFLNPTVEKKLIAEDFWEVYLRTE